MDRFYRGLTAGLVGGVVMNAWSLFSYHVLHLTTIRFLDWSSVILYGHLPTSTFEAVYALIIQILWAGFLAVLFAYLVPTVTSRGYLGKGMFFGLSAGFLIYAIPKLYKIPELVITPDYTVLTDHIGGIIWGLTMAYTLRLLDTSTNRKKHSLEYYYLIQTFTLLKWFYARADRRDQQIALLIER